MENAENGMPEIGEKNTKSNREFRKLKVLFNLSMALSLGGLAAFGLNMERKQQIRSGEITKIINTVRAEDESNDKVNDDEILDSSEKEKFENAKNDATKIREVILLSMKGEDKDWYKNIQGHFDWIGWPRIEILKKINDILNDDLDDGEIEDLFHQPEKKSWPDTQFEGFGKVGIPEAEMSKAYTDLLPPNCGKVIGKVGISDSLQGDAIGQCYPPKGNERSTVELSGDSSDFGWSNKTKDPTFRSVICHEAGHALDWDKNPYLSDADKIHLLRMVMERMADKNRFHSDYVEVAKLTSLDSKGWYDAYQTYGGTQEYYADLFALYFSGLHFDGYSETGWGSQDMPKADREIIEWVVAHSDPEWLAKHGPHHPDIKKQPDSRHYNLK